MTANLWTIKSILKVSLAHECSGGRRVSVAAAALYLRVVSLEHQWDPVHQNGCAEEFACTQRGREAPAGRHHCSPGREETGVRIRNAVCG